MLVVICVAAAAAAAVVAYAQVQRRSPEASTASLRAVRELAAVVLVLVKAVEAVVDVLGHQRVQTASSPSRCANREALGSFLDAWDKAAGLADEAFGPVLPLPRLGESVSVK